MRSRFALLIAPLLILSILPGAVSAAGPAAQAESRADVLAYWTPARMKSAKWLDVEVDRATKEGRLIPRSTATVGDSGGALWPATLDDEITRVTGRVYFSFGKGSAYVCSGTVVNDNGRAGYSTVLTAAHCVFDQKSRKYASMWLFIPAFDVAKSYTCSATALGCWNKAAIVTRTEFTSSRRLTTDALAHDWAFVVVGGGGKTGASRQLDADVSLTTTPTGLALETGSGVGTRMTAIGYPAASPYNGYELAYCQGIVYTDPLQANRTYGMDCDMTGGSSGGPWVKNANSGFGATLRSLNSYGYGDDASMYGPVFGSDTAATFARAQAKTSGNEAISTN